MRNGNFFFNVSFIRVYPSSYRTYEEWKRKQIEELQAQLKGSYRTYEEWKPWNVRPSASVIMRSYRTYEEWKLRSPTLFLFHYTKFLPYLWGMETSDRRIWLWVPI